ncbi:multidrug effflux MFS transporter [Microbulbifer spongiae]|uniref:Bcr/CflA family efflux transporter n=1 Tax=Microbulbifer spongiae TaxID=2944933 RepID=A0ABY9EBY8_9GAMM|nr:multidrug effflux MFS transporter [Microbulbifer sp. MI-G]WKD49802.1 multidrug effflux MFS transporter [Microbulbifer sp. MI-G]
MSTMRRQNEIEFVSLIAIMSALGALSIDAVLPAMPQMAASLGMPEGNAAQLIVGVLFLGMTIGQLIYGPVSDCIGRRPTLLVGVVVFMLGSLVSALAENSMLFIAGRFLQGAGAAALRIVPLAIVRDRFEGALMARIMSWAMSIFILVPCIAPMLGQGILSLAGWRAIFWLLFTLSCITAVWSWVRQPETLPHDKRRSGGIAAILEGLSATLSNRITGSYLIALGLIQGVFMGYIMSAEQIYRGIFGVDNLFAFFFALAAISIGIASILNAKLVKHFGLEDICRFALLGVIAISGSIYILGLFAALPLYGFLAAVSSIFFCFGLLIGNMNTIALQPLGHVAGLANSTISFLSGCIALAFGWLISGIYTTSVQSLMLGALIAGLLSVIAVMWGSRSQVNIGESPSPQMINTGG